jgi:hypothetical protein
MNPFKKNNQMLPVASINSVFVDDVKAYDLFRPTLIAEEIMKNKDQLGLSNFSDHQKLLADFNDLLISDLDSIRSKAYEIATMFGYRLAKVLSTLFNPSLKSITNRENWTKLHWDFWKEIDRVYLVGGLTSPILTNIFYECIQETFQKENIKGKVITFMEGSSNLGTKGMASLTYDGDYLLFDFGQTNIKRGRHMKKDGLVVIDTVLPTIPANYLFYKTKNQKEVIKIAKKLHRFILKTIDDSAKLVAFSGSEVYMSIANYIDQGKIYAARGGYGKLAFLHDNYQEYLSQELSKKWKKKVSVTLFHDTSAMALLYQDQPNTAVISLGTAFGVAFPN